MTAIQLIDIWLQEGRKVPITVGYPNNPAMARREREFPKTVDSMVSKSQPLWSSAIKGGKNRYVRQELMPALQGLSYFNSLDPNIQSAVKREYDLHLDRHADKQIAHIKRSTVKAGIFNRDWSKGPNWKGHNTAARSVSDTFSTRLKFHDAGEHGLLGAMPDFNGEDMVNRFVSLVGNPSKYTHKKMHSELRSNLDFNYIKHASELGWNVTQRNVDAFGAAHPDLHPSEHMNEYAKHLIGISKKIRQGNKRRVVA